MENQDLLYSTGNYIQYLIITYSGKKSENIYIHMCVHAQSCPTLCDPMNCSPPGSSIHGISKASILDWVAISFSRGSSQPRDPTEHGFS